MNELFIRDSLNLAVATVKLVFVGVFALYFLSSTQLVVILLHSEGCGVL